MHAGRERGTGKLLVHGVLFDSHGHGRMVNVLGIGVRAALVQLVVHLRSHAPAKRDGRQHTR